MKKFDVTFQIIHDGVKLIEHVIVEAGNKKTAIFRAFSELGKKREYSDSYKNMIAVEEVSA